MIDALLACFDEGDLRPAASDIAARAGVSERSVFRHFDDLEALASEAFDRQFARVADYFAPPSAEGSLEKRISALVDQRCRLYERMANLIRAANQSAVNSSTMATHVRERRAWLRDQVAAQFAPELADLGARDRRLLLASLDATTSLEHLDYLRRNAAVGARDLKTVLRRALAALLTPPPAPTQEPS